MGSGQCGICKCGLICGILKGMCVKLSKLLTSCQPASFLFVWDLIFGFKCMMYDVLFSLPICYAWLGISGTFFSIGICIHMRTWCLDFNNCDAFELFD